MDDGKIDYDNLTLEQETKLKNEYDEMLNENGEIKIGSYSYEAARVLKMVDKIAYDQGFQEFIDSKIKDGF